VYDSWYGNTRFIAEAIADGLEGDVQVIKSNDDPYKYLSDCELLVVGSPTHGGVVTPNMHEFLDSLNGDDLEGIAVAVFDTRMTQRWLKVIGFAAPRIAKQLQQKCGTLIMPPEGFYVTGKEGPLKDNELARAINWGAHVAQKVKAGAIA